MVQVHGAKLGRLLEIKERGIDGSGRGGPYYGNVGLSNNYAGPFEGGPLAPDLGESTFAPGALSTNVTVLAVFEIVDATEVY
jgi:hypothetical protein